jgi:HEPN domain-containing protein
MAKRSYLELAASDMAAAKVLLEGGFYDHCGRMCQQAVEKYMKHVIEFSGMRSDRNLMHTHKIHLLYDRIASILNVTVDKTTKDNMVMLTDYYFETNYPSDEQITLNQDEAEAAMKIAGDLIKLISDASGYPDITHIHKKESQTP